MDSEAVERLSDLFNIAWTIFKQSQAMLARQPQGFEEQDGLHYFVLHELPVRVLQVMAEQLIRLSEDLQGHRAPMAQVKKQDPGTPSRNKRRKK